MLLRVLQRAGWRLKWAGWRWVELSGGWNKLGEGGWSWVEVGGVGGGWNKLSGGEWSWVELGGDGWSWVELVDGLVIPFRNTFFTEHLRTTASVSLVTDSLPWVNRLFLLIFLKRPIIYGFIDVNNSNKKNSGCLNCREFWELLPLIEYM